MIGRDYTLKMDISHHVILKGLISPAYCCPLRLDQIKERYRGSGKSIFPSQGRCR